ncbi:hypothetical protein [Lichenihabitans psoromatis]|uniref:hypothetical protein n=1 Tax=Lichenihabitans psoromatis TaxID=2528642 RepID=UPI001035D352|nr:hypothetical protein [Lichenihabitans psoromatis]
METFYAFVRRLSVSLMLLAIVALALQAGGTSAFAFGGVSDCPNDVHVATSIFHGDEAAAVDRGDGGHVHTAPCKSACCHAACSLAMFAEGFPLLVPAPVASGIVALVVRVDAGIDPKGLSRPPRTRPSV